MARRAQQFQTIRSEGGLLPPDLLRRIIDPSGNLKGTRPEDYGLPQSERLSEAVTQSWNRLRRHWVEFLAVAARLPEGEAATGLTNDKWNVPLLRELGFGLLPTSGSPEMAGRTYAISRFFGSVPIHLVGCGLSLDRRTAGVRGAAGSSPHGLVQEFLNRSQDHLWGIVANGLRLRILRDSHALSRQSFLEFDLESMFNAEAYSDFVLFWLVGHATRFAPRDGHRIESCWLEEWTKEAQEQGTRALKDLRGSVERALQVLGEGLTSHPKNTTLREALRSGSLPLLDFHAQLLRVVYRLIFLFVAEDRTLEGQPLLHPPDDSEPARIARERYAAHYGTARLRELAGKIKGSRHGDLWRQFQVLVCALSGESVFEAARRNLALPALGSLLWSPGSTVALNDAELTNSDFLEALRHLAYTRQGKLLRPVDYMNLGAEELGGVYETLLALTPQISADGAHFNFAEFAGNERKTSGSYYTPDSLVQCLLDSALDPVVEEAIKGKSAVAAEKVILGLKVCDPAVGSGHFLVGAAHRLARHLSRVRAHAQGESEPSPLLYQHALRDVIGRCLYGVDMNPMAAELCRVSLWLEALQPGKPLSFLDHHVRVGDSLLGTTPGFIRAGLPDDAFSSIEGDDKKICAALKKRNKQEREGQQDMVHIMLPEPRNEYNWIAERARRIEEASDETIDEIRRKADQFLQLAVSPELQHAQQTADAWCAAFVWEKRASASTDAITTDTIRRLESGSKSLPPAQRSEVERLSAHYKFFHWHLAFPEVFSDGGFDCVLGNPPWGQIQFEPGEFFANRAPIIAGTSNTAERERMIARLQREDPDLFSAYTAEMRQLQARQLFVHASGRFPTTSFGRLNTAPLFVETSRNITRPSGRVGVIVPTGIATDSFNQFFFQKVVNDRALFRLHSFENEEFVFPEVHHATKFCLFTCASAKGSSVTESEFVFFARRVEHLKDPERLFHLQPHEVALLNPNTRTCPIFRFNRDAELTKAIHRRLPVLVTEGPPETNPWSIAFRLMFMMNTDSHRFRTRAQLEADGYQRSGNLYKRENDRFLPLYEGKMIHHFDHRWGTYEGQTDAQANQGKLPESDVTMHADPHYQALSHYWVVETDVNARVPSVWSHDWLLGWRDITGAAVYRTVISSVIPRYAVANNLPLILSSASAESLACLCANLNSFVLDYVSRQKVGGSHINFYLLQQFPLIVPAFYVEPYEWSDGPLCEWLTPRVIELIYTAWELEAFARDCGWDGPPFRWDEERRFLIRCELDAAFFHFYLPVDADGDWRAARMAYGCPHNETPDELAELKRHFQTPRDAVGYIMDTFPIVRRKDEEKYNGDYRTKRVILKIYDAMQEAIRTGQPYQTCLDPLPGPPKDADGNFLIYAQIAGNPPPHVHLPRGAAVGGVALQLSDLASRFPTAPFLLRFGTSGDSKALRIRPVRTPDIRASDRVVLASANLRNAGSVVPAAIGKLRVEARTDASDGSAYMLVTVRGDEGTAQARFSDEEWRGLTTVGVVDAGDGS
jgi:hypothetical protein